MWYLGVNKDGSLDLDGIEVTLMQGGVATLVKFNVKIRDGFIKVYKFTDGVQTVLNEPLLDAISDRLLTNPMPDADHYLLVTKDANSEFSQELKNFAEKTVATCAGNISAPVIAKYEFDILGNLETEIAPKNGATTLISDATNVYNSLGQLIKKTTADGGMFGYAYTRTGQLACDTSYDGTGTIYRIRHYKYDELDRLVTTELENSDGSKTVVLRNYYHDIDNLSLDASKYSIPQGVLLSLKNIRGRLVASVAVNNVGGLSYYVSDLFSYDNDGRIGKKIKAVPGMPIQEINYTYDLQGKVLTDATKCGAQTIEKEYVYNSDGLLEEVVHSNNTGKNLVTYGYDDYGKTKSKTLGLTIGHQLDYAYNIRDWLTSIGPATGNSHVNTFTETVNQYQPDGNIQNAVYDYGYLDPVNGPDNKEFDLT
ncbi:MAG TPA: hypothetical protein VHO70_15130 [Chitinispirillaceae bacterium]|nr:hypothetical protein [Chitinispirillaceae bacterium]